MSTLSTPNYIGYIKMPQNNHAPQRREDQIVVLKRGGQVHAVGYICHKCGNPVFPLGSTFPDEALTKEEKELLYNEKMCSD
jgi:hypothetical protein